MTLFEMTEIIKHLQQYEIKLFIQITVNPLNFRGIHIHKKKFFLNSIDFIVECIMIRFELQIVYPFKDVTNQIFPDMTINPDDLKPDLEP